MRGRHPVDASVLRVMGSCSTVSALDLTFSAPKSVSVLFAIAEDDVAAAMVAAHGAQGATVAWAGVIGRPREFTREWAYTALSRAREQTTLHVIAQPGRHGPRPSAVDKARDHVRAEAMTARSGEPWSKPTAKRWRWSTHPALSQGGSRQRDSPNSTGWRKPTCVELCNGATGPQLCPRDGRGAKRQRLRL